jgi:hypothetical protein
MPCESADFACAELLHRLGDLLHRLQQLRIHLLWTLRDTPAGDELEHWTLDAFEVFARHDDHRTLTLTIVPAAGGGGGGGAAAAALAPPPPPPPIIIIIIGSIIDDDELLLLFAARLLMESPICDIIICICMVWSVVPAPAARVTPPVTSLSW